MRQAVTSAVRPPAKYGVLGVAADTAAPAGSSAAGAAGERRELGLQLVARTDMERAPASAAGRRGTSRGSRSWPPKSTMCSSPPGGSQSQRPVERRPPARDHRQAVGEEDAREARHAEQPGRIERGGVGAGERDARGEPGARRRPGAPCPASRPRCRCRRTAPPARRAAAATRLRAVPQPISSTRPPDGGASRSISRSRPSR